MKRCAVLILSSFLIVSVSRGDAPDRLTLERVRALTLEGVHALFNFQVESANQKFNEAISIEPRYPRPYYSRALVHLWKAFVTRSPSDYEESLRLLTEAIEVGRKYLDDVDDHDADVLTALGSAYGYRAYVHIVTKSYLKGTWDAKKCYDYLSDAVAADPNFYDAYLGLGLYHFSVATIPKPLQWIISILGVEGNRDLGIREIELAARRGMYNAAEAKYFLIQFYPWYKGDFDIAEKLVDDLIRTYPANTVFLYAKGFLKFRQNNITAALPYFLKMKEVSSEYLSIINKFAELRIGECYFRLGEYARAKEAYLAFLVMNNKGQFEATANFHAGLATEMLGDRSSALPLYLRAKNFNGVHGDDLYAARRAAQLLVSPLSLVDTLLISARNLHRRGLYEKAVALYTDILHSYSLTNDQRAEVVYRMGECLYDDGKFDEAGEQFRTVLGLKVTSELWVLPWSHFMLGQIAMKQQDYATAKREYELVGEYDGYDHKNWLTFRTEQELERLKNHNNNAGTR